MIINNDNNVLENVVRRIEIKKGDDNGWRCVFIQGEWMRVCGQRWWMVSKLKKIKYTVWTIFRMG
jgi:hypothetical protein